MLLFGAKIASGVSLENVDAGSTAMDAGTMKTGSAVMGKRSEAGMKRRTELIGHLVAILIGTVVGLILAEVMPGLFKIIFN